MKKYLSILIIVMFSILQIPETFAATFQYSSVEKTKNKLMNFQKRSSKRQFKPRKKWQQHFRRHGEQWLLVGIIGLTAIFTTLKLTQIIAWSWLWILSPIWITITLLILIFIYVIILFLLMPAKQPISPAE